MYASILKKLCLILSVFLVLSTYADSTKRALPKADESIHFFSLESNFTDAKEDLLASIEDNGLVVSYIAHAKAMFDRTADVTGEKTPIYNDAEIVLFCKANLSHNLVAANPHNLILCPYAISIYVLHNEPNRVYLSYQEHGKAQAVTQAINTLLKSIIENVL